MEGLSRGGRKVLNRPWFYSPIMATQSRRDDRNLRRKVRTMVDVGMELAQLVPVLGTPIRLLVRAGERDELARKRAENSRFKRFVIATALRHSGQTGASPSRALVAGFGSGYKPSPPRVNPAGADYRALPDKPAFNRALTVPPAPGAFRRPAVTTGTQPRLSLDKSHLSSVRGVQRSIARAARASRSH